MNYFLKAYFGLQFILIFCLGNGIMLGVNAQETPSTYTSLLLTHRTLNKEIRIQPGQALKIWTSQNKRIKGIFSEITGNHIHLQQDAKNSIKIDIAHIKKLKNIRTQ